jgi:multiple sugar transport system substrate-binding protein
MTVWAHAGQASERTVLQAQVAQFNQSHGDLPIRLTLIPARQYTVQVQAAALVRRLLAKHRPLVKD